jgi:hypothetical protein
MTIEAIISYKALKSKHKTILLSNYLLDRTFTTDELVTFSQTAKDPIKATCIEALEFASKQEPGILTIQAFQFVTTNLQSKAPRVKWESAKVIANSAHLFSGELKHAIKNLLENSTHSATVVRWSAAFALAEIIQLNTSANKSLLPTIESICNREEKNSIKKIYLNAIKKVK